MKEKLEQAWAASVEAEATEAILSRRDLSEHEKDKIKETGIDFASTRQSINPVGEHGTS